MLASTTVPKGSGLSVCPLLRATSSAHSRERLPRPYALWPCAAGAALPPLLLLSLPPVLSAPLCPSETLVWLSLKTVLTPS